MAKGLLTKRSIWVSTIVLGLMVVMGVYLWGTRSRLTTLAEVLAGALQTDPSTIQPNLPPADGRYPGCVLVRPSAGQIAALRLVEQPADANSVQMIGDLGTVQSVAASGLLSGSLRGLGGKAASTADLEVSIELKGVRVFEIEIGNELKKRLMADADVVSAERRRLKPEVVIRSYEATPVFTVKQGAAVTAEVWEETKQRLLRAGAAAAAGGMLRLVATRPVVVAYETVSVEFVAGTFSAGGITDVVLTPQINEPSTLALVDPTEFGLRGSGERVNYVGLGTSHYRSTEFGNLRSVDPSIELITAALEQLGAATIPGVTNPPSESTSRAAIDAFLDQVVTRVTIEKPDAFVLYYAGHAIARAGGQMYLVLSDYDGNLMEDMGKETMLGLPRAQTEAPRSPLSRSNIGDIMDVVNAAAGEFPTDTPGLYAVAEIHERLERGGVPFAIVIDGCFESDVMEQLRQELQLTQTGYYLGPSDLPADELALYAKALRQFGVAPYLHDTNPVILSARPGSLALEVSHPVFDWEFSPNVGPLAARMYRLTQASIVRGDNINWGQILRGLADYAATGETETTGSMSWSDFSTFERIQVLQRDQ